MPVYTKSFHFLKIYNFESMLSLCQKNTKLAYNINEQLWKEEKKMSLKLKEKYLLRMLSPALNVRRLSVDAQTTQQQDLEE